MKPFLTVYGHVCLDQIMSLAQFPEPNTSVDILEKHRYFGGTGANIATVAASLGVPTALVSYVGSDLPDEFRRNMESRGVDLSEMVTVEGYETSAVMILTDDEQDQVAFVYQGPMKHMDAFDLLITRASESEIVHVSTGRPGYYLRLMERMRLLGKNISFDPSQEIHHIWSANTFSKGIALADTFFCNVNELRTALRYMGMEHPEDLLGTIGAVVNTCGADGSTIYTAEGTMHMPAIRPETMVDPTGAGDSFRAGYYAGRYRGLPLHECLAHGSAAASFALEAKGAVGNVPNWDMVVERARPLLDTP